MAGENCSIASALVTGRNRIASQRVIVLMANGCHPASTIEDPASNPPSPGLFISLSKSMESAFLNGGWPLQQNRFLHKRVHPCIT
jgi:hypothetical protein